jgi:hypothetical protein
LFTDDEVMTGRGLLVEAGVAVGVLCLFFVFVPFVIFEDGKANAKPRFSALAVVAGRKSGEGFAR